MVTAAPADAALFAPWADLPSDLLREISGRLRTAANYVRFHAVCCSWRDALPPPDRRPALLPWLVSPRDVTGHRYARCIFSSMQSSPQHRELRIRDRIWVTSSEDGTARYWLQTTSSSFTEGSARSPVDPLTGSATAMHIPRSPDEVEGWEERAVGVSCADGTIALYADGRGGQGFDAAIRHPGDAKWTLVQRKNMDVAGEEWSCCCLPHRHGKIILSNMNQWRIVSTEKPAADDQRWQRMPREPKKWVSSGHLVETRGELLWVFVQLDTENIYLRYHYGFRASVGGDLAGALSVSVYALQEAADGGVPRWMKRDARSLADRVLFLGPVTSFAVDAASLGMSSGCAYFVERIRGPYTYSRLFKYSFNDAKSEFMEELPPRWNRKPFMWVSPQPAIATKEEIRSRAQHFRIYVGNLPPEVDSNRLRQFFSKHGKVVDARIMYHRKTRCSRGFGFITMMATKDDQPADAIAKLRGQSWDGRPLQVKLTD